MLHPQILNGRTIRKYRIGPYKAAMDDRLVARPVTEYAFVMPVWYGDEELPRLYVTSEVNDPDVLAKLEREMGIAPDPDDEPEVRTGGTHFLCVVDEKAHHNLGDSDDWGDELKFEAAALRILEERLGHPVEVTWPAPPKRRSWFARLLGG